MRRRQFLAGTAALLGARAWGQQSARPRLPRVLVSRDRIVRTVVGLRPFRPSGFVVRTEKVGDRTVVHNYGHGGCGVTLSWGTAQLAVEQALATGAKRVAVLGCGAVGLATARLLQEKKIEATIYARDLPGHTTSDIAGGRWYPFDLFDKSRIGADFLPALWRLSRVAYDRFRALLGDEYGVRYLPTYNCRHTPVPKESLLSLDSPIKDMLPGLRDLRPEEKPFSYEVVRTFQTLMIEPAIYLPRVLHDYERAGGHVEKREFKDVSELSTLRERVIVNCTGFGARALFGDTEMLPIKGQLTILKPQPEVGYVALPGNLYMFPRRDGILLGGTFERGVSTLEPNREAEERILRGHAEFFAAT